MNKYQEALEFLLANLDDEWFGWDDLEEKWEHIDNVQELVDKATPVKPVVLTKTICCSKCDTRLGDNNGWTQATVNFCPDCGQAIDWSKE